MINGAGVRTRLERQRSITLIVIVSGLAELWKLLSGIRFLHFPSGRPPFVQLLPSVGTVRFKSSAPYTSIARVQSGISGAPRRDQPIIGTDRCYPCPFRHEAITVLTGELVRRAGEKTIANHAIRLFTWLEEILLSLCYLLLIRVLHRLHGTLAVSCQTKNSITFVSTFICTFECDPRAGSRRHRARQGARDDQEESPVR